MNNFRPFSAPPSLPLDPTHRATERERHLRSAVFSKRWSSALLPILALTALILLPCSRAWAQLSAKPSSIKFWAVDVGNQSTRNVTIKNTGASSVTVSQSSVSGNGFSITGLSLPLTLQPGARSTFTAVFAPTGAGQVLGSITLVSTATNSPTVVSLAGTGVTLLLSLSPGSTNFGNVNVGNNSTLPVLLTNTGSSRVTITQSIVTGTGFSISGLALPLTLYSGKNTSFNVTFSPNATGLSTGDVSIVSTATNSPANGSLAGTGVDPASVGLTWNASNSQGIVGYNVFRSQVSGGPYTQLNSSLDTTTSYTDNSVLSGQTYYYVTTAVNGQNTQSAYSDQAEAVVP